MTMYDDVLDVTLSLDTNAYADGDVLAAPQEVPMVGRVRGGVVQLGSLHLLDKDDQGGILDLVFMNATGSLGAENAACAPTDAVAATIIGTVSVVAADYVDLANSQCVTKTNLKLGLKCAHNTQSLWIAAISRDTKTYTAAGITLKLYIKRD